MNYLALLLIALVTMAPSAVEAGKGKGKGKGMYETTPVPVDLCENETIAEKYYSNSTDPGPSIFQLNMTCEDTTCVGQVLTFKSPLYLDKYLHYPAGFAIGHCIVVAAYVPKDSHEPTVYKPYCLYTYEISYEKELDYYDMYHEKIICEFDAEVAVQGVGSLGSESSTQLITAAAGLFEGLEGSVTVAPTEKYPEVFESYFEFLE
jgi:hypothetical protein